jgi:hypothetical protein
VITVRLTPAGQSQIENLENILDEVEGALNTLPKSDQETLLRALRIVVRHLQEAGYVKVYEMCWGCQFFQREAHPEDPRGPHHCTFVDAPLPEPHTYLECPDFTPVQE